MPGRGFLDVAREVAAGTTPFHWRSASVDAYYALFLGCRDVLFRWGFRMPRRDNVHAWVRLRFTYASDSDLKAIGDALDRLVRLRSQASYDLTPLPKFASPVEAQDAIQSATNALAMLDSFTADPAREAAAIGAIGP